MTEEQRIEIPKPKGHYCFACGTANPIGLNLQFYRLGNTVCSDITLEREYEGWQNMAHGGVISALLDEIMSWTIIYFRKTFLVTRKMEVKYIKPVLIGTPLTVRGNLMNDLRPPKIRANAEILDDQGTLLVRSSGEFIMLSKEKLSSVPEGLKKEMLSLFDNFE